METSPQSFVPFLDYQVKQADRPGRHQQGERIYSQVSGYAPWELSMLACGDFEVVICSLVYEKGWRMIYRELAFHPLTGVQLAYAHLWD